MDGHGGGARQDIRLAPGLDPAALGPAFQANGRLHVPGILSADSAEAVARALAEDVPWSLSVNAAGEMLEMPLERMPELDEAERARLGRLTADGSNPAMQYVFETWRVGLFVDYGQRLGNAVEAVYDFLNGAAFLDFVRELTGDDRPEFCDAQATRYRAGHFLTAHDDYATGKNRLYAYVLNFTRDWRADFGGLLQFHDAEGHVAQAWTPAFNALNLFAVPQAHAVSCVTPFAQGARLSITGWVRARG